MEQLPSHSSHTANNEPLTTNHSPQTTHHQPQTDVSIDIKPAWNWMKKHAAWLWILLLILIPIVASTSIRMQTMYLPVTDEWARNNVHSFIRSDLAVAISRQYPNLPQQNLNSLIDEQLTTAIKEGRYVFKAGQYAGQAMDINNEIVRSSSGLKSFFQYEENGKTFTYMPDIDPYTYLRYARNVITKGRIGDEVRDGVQWDNHMIAPFGTSVDETVHPYVLAWLYRIFHFFSPSITLMQAATYFPVVFAILSIIPAFFIGRRIGGNVGGFFAALMLAVNGAFLNRTFWGHADTDAYVVFFPLLAAWLFMEGLEASSWKKGALFMGLAGLSVGFFSWVWTGWWYIFDFLLLAAGAALIYTVLSLRFLSKKNWKETAFHPSTKNIVLSVLCFVIASGIFVSLIVGPSFFFSSVGAPFDFISTVKEASRANLWPNVLTTVAELNEVSYEQTIGILGGTLFFAIALVGIVASAMRKDEHGTIDLKYALFISIWMAATFFASTKGIRFTMLVVPAFSLAFGAAIGGIDRLGAWLARMIHVHKHIITGVVLIVFFLLFIPPMKAGYSAARGDIPIVNDAWYDTLTAIRDASQPNAIITSWWDFGHHFKYFADRPVTFDGATQNEPMAHWAGKILLTDNEKLAVGLLRMLDCGSNTAFDKIDDVINDTPDTIAIINEIVVQDKVAAKKTLITKGLTAQQADDVLDVTHCNPPEAFFITSGDMVGKAPVWAHFGSWDFHRAEAWYNAKGKSYDEAIEFFKTKQGMTDEQARQAYSEISSLTDERAGNAWIAPWPSFASDAMGCSRDGMKLSCGGVFVDLGTLDARVGTNQGDGVPYSLVFPTTAGIEERRYDNFSAPYSVLIIPDGDIFKAMVMQPPLATSMFTRMFFLNGHGLQYFKPFKQANSFVGGNILTWKVDWSGASATAAYKKEQRALAPEELPLPVGRVSVDGREGNLTVQKVPVPEGGA